MRREEARERPSRKRVDDEQVRRSRIGEEIRQLISQHERANVHFFEDGLKLFELAQDLPAKYVMATADEKREILAFLASNYTLTDATLDPTYNKPFCWFAEYVKTKERGPLSDSASNKDVWLGTPRWRRPASVLLVSS